ncbi:MAG: T9SS type A sorting domain-containing protein [Paludibacter sp.]|jgi:hypothetical protein|nr:T9SS type A sorting domain-containing protein [Paludibacter sp.]
MRKTLLSVFCAVAALSLSAQVAPESGNQYRIHNADGLYLSYDANWSDAGWNLFYNDTLYTTVQSVPYTWTETSYTMEYNPANQIFTLTENEGTWKIATNGSAYIVTVDNGGTNTWDITATGTSLDGEGSTGDWTFIPENDYYLLQVVSGKYLASDASTSGFTAAGARSNVYYNKDNKTSAHWTFEPVTTASAKETSATQELNVYANATTLFVNVENGTAISVYSVSGSKVIDSIVSNGKVNVSNLAAGVYVVSTPAGKAKFVKK